MLRTKSGLPKHCTHIVDRHGKRRVRFRKKGFSTYITGTPWSEGFMRQYAAALDGVKVQASNIGAQRTKQGSFDASLRFLLPLARFSQPQIEHASDASERHREVPTPAWRQAAQRTRTRTHQ
jgi:hypothetical protein